MNNKHGSKQHEGTAPAISIQRNQIVGSDPTKSHQEQVFQSEQQRVPIEYYQNIKNQLDQARSYIIQWQETNKKLYKDANELEGQLNEEVALNHNLRTQLQTLQDVNKRWEQA